LNKAPEVKIAVTGPSLRGCSYCFCLYCCRPVCFPVKHNSF
jgi:hypothetical protein